MAEPGKQKSNENSVDSSKIVTGREIEDKLEEKKRKRDLSSQSSQSDMETVIKRDDKNKNKQKKKKSKQQQGKFQEIEEEESDASDQGYKELDSRTILHEIREINKKLENVITKDDGSMKVMMSSLINHAKEEILKSVEKKLEVLESKIFEKQVENDKLRDSVATLTVRLKSSDDENKKLKAEILRQHEQTQDQINNLEQYGRRNNVRIDGITDTENETASETGKMVVEILNAKIPELKLTTRDIDIAHRIGSYKKENKRTVIVKLVSRMTKQEILRKKKIFGPDKVYINEDLTKTNRAVLQSVRLKQKDFVQGAWSRDGTIYYRDINEMTHQVKFSSYKYWMELPWPERKQP